MCYPGHVMSNTGNTVGYEDDYKDFFFGGGVSKV